MIALLSCLLACLYGQAYSTALNWTQEAASFVVGQAKKANKLGGSIDSTPVLISYSSAAAALFCFFRWEKKNVLEIIK